MTDQTETVEAVEVHSYDGTEYQIGETYELPCAYVDSVIAQGKAKRVDQAAKPNAPKRAAKPTAPKRASKPVKPLSTHDLKTTEIVTKRKTSLGAKRRK